MRLWISGEVCEGAESAVNLGAKLIEPCFNRLLEKVEFKEDYEKWALITIIMTDEFISAYPEIVRRSIKKKVLEFRLQIDYVTFKSADQQGQIKLVLDTLERSVDLMTQLKVSKESQDKLKAVVNEARQQLLT
ncbi:hypothetical protein [Hydromonas duriensis]|uniref:Immunity protein 44 of polymorphic toxin system n=1 Tax=Hydromonas duriensis TaxID=1527608 RepID=A0A4R6Y1B4_9BURK|nr:hypothetical protein [Hydromonas duriensis]TDR25011.1 hypothetical protein DFR44_1752 [Hydromonas duriensis]